MPLLRNRTPAAGPAYTPEQADLRAAYNRGREDERHSRRRHPLLAIAVVILALIGAWLLFLTAREGSFSTAGQVADRNISTAADQAGPALRDTGAAIKDAGANLADRTQDSVASTEAPADAQNTTTLQTAPSQTPR